MSQETSSRLKDIFQNPNRCYAIYPIIHGNVATGDRPSDWIDQRNFVQAHHLDWMEKNGFAGIVGNVPYGRNFPDDDYEWEKTAEGFRNYINRGFYTWIYDEKGYPSGSARGVVTERHPEYVAQGLFCYEYWRTLVGPCFYRSDVPGDKLFRAMLLPLDGGEAIDVTHFANENGTLKMDVPEGNYHLFMMSSRRLFDGTHAAESYSEPRDYISLSDKEATEEFIRVTHENYAKKLSDEFGKGVRAFFTDEPSLISWCLKPQPYPIMPWHRTYEEEFKKKYGYPIEYAVVAVVTQRGLDVTKRRCDFWEFIAETVAENFFGTIQNWCHAHGIKSSGHFLHEEQLQGHVYNYGSLYQSGKRMDWPGIDILTSEPTELMMTGKLPIGRLLASFADISGENETFTEFSDLSSRFQNRLISLDWVRSSVNWHFAMGINNFTSYYIWNNFLDQDFKPLNTYVSRIGGILRQGKRDSRTAVLYPEAAIWAAYTPATTSNAVDKSEKTLRVNDTFSQISWELLHRQIDFDYVDEDLILDGEIKGGKLCYKAREYECVVLPEAYVLRRTTVDKLVEMMKHGIGVIIVGEIPSIARESGKEENFMEKFVPFLNTKVLNIVSTSTSWSLPGKAALTALPRPIEVFPGSADTISVGAANNGSFVNGEAVSENILSHVRVMPDGTRIVYLANMGFKTYDGCLIVHGGKSAEKADPMTGEVTAENAIVQNDALKIDINLKAYDAMIWIVK